jgi:DNA helicase-2/ATP-dependent DNA helicase PcrA
MQLNAEQSKAVCFSPNHPLLLTAGPGSGKTLTLLHRVIRLTSELTPGIDESMLLLTFSKAAVGEMISRLQVHNISYSICQVMTFHSFAFKFIKTHYIEAGYRVTPKVASKAERLQIMKEAIDLLNLLDLKKILADKKRTNELLKFLADAKRAFDLDAFFGDNCVQSMKDLYRCVQRLLQEKCLLEFDDMIPLTNSCFQRNPLLLAQYWGKYRYILCDEYQDTNARQRQLLLLLGTSGRITAVGDKDQLIYGFQGADVNNFKLFDFAFRSIGGAKRMALQTNYRSRGPIIRVCNDIIRHNHDEGDKGSMMRAAADRESGDAVRIVECLGTVDCELRHVLEWAQGLLRTHRVTHAEDMAVLCRDNDTANKVGQFIKKHTQDFGISLSLGNLEGRICAIQIVTYPCL